MSHGKLELSKLLITPDLTPLPTFILQTPYKNKNGILWGGRSVTH